MTISYTALLGLAQPVTGTETGQWGTVVNDEITALLEDAVANAASISVTAGNVTLSTTNGSSNQARMSTLIITGTPGTTRNVVAPSQAKIYVVINQSDGAVVIKGAATSGVTIGAGQTAQVAWNGSDFVEIGNYVHGNFVVNGNLSVNGDSTLGNAGADTTTINGQVIAANSNISKTTTLSASAPALAWIKGATYTDTGTAGGTTQALAPFTVFSTPTLSTSNIVTYTDAATVYIAGAPAAAGSATITNPYSLYVAAGNAYFGASVSATTLDLTNLEVTNIKAKDGTASMTLADSTGVVTVVKDQLVNGVTVGRGAGAVSTNTAVGASALAANTSGAQNTTVGNQAGATTNAAYLTAVGYQAARYNTGDGNTAIGTNALLVAGGVDGTGTNNTAIGKDALYTNTTSSNNTAVGYQAAYLGNGESRVMIGYQAGYANQGGNNSVGVGYAALSAETTGGNNIGIGYGACSVTNGYANVAVGTQAMNGANAGAFQNTAIGQQALRYVTGSNNVAVGYNAAYNTTSDTLMIAIGYQALYNNTTGGGGSYNIAVGPSAHFYGQTDSYYNIAIGANAHRGTSNGTQTGKFNTAIGNPITPLTTGSYVLGEITSGSYNAAVGNGAMGLLTSGSYNTAFGVTALRSNTTASYNTAVGMEAGYTNQTGANVTYIGRRAGYLATGSGNTFVGMSSGDAVTSGANNTILGRFTGNNGGLDIRTASNYIVLSDGDGNPRFWHNGANAAINSTSGTFSADLTIRNIDGSGSGKLSLAASSAGGGGASSIAMGNNDSGGTAGPNVIVAANRNLQLGRGNSFTGTPGTVTTDLWVTEFGIGLQGAQPQSGIGLRFPASQSASSDANTLDDYEEGEYDVTMSTSASGSITLVAGENRFSYTKIGRQVTVTGAIQIDSVSSPVGFFNISLPFAIADLTEAAGRGSASVVVVNVVSANVADFLPISIEGESNLRVYLGDGTNIQDDSAQQLQATSGIYVTFTYFA